ncbi:hypothetical protein [Massilia sp. Dwa41.01b]|uniref:hypothetical protein n=1 Tax=Massilia sp. Dwa41.01b TaxID=2709302 RepID=UPI001E5FD70A|nr:hypothetical protein [Massilia sp. Dwa41.01b]
MLTRYHAVGSAGPALVAAFPQQGPVRSAVLAPGDYRVPAAPPAALEDAALFDSLLARGLLRLAPGGLVEVAPRDLALWRMAGADLRAADLHRWDGVRLDAEGLRLLARLHGRADGAFVREQVRIFNAERRLLAWRLRPGGLPAGSWQASVGGVAVSARAAMPPASSRLFASLPAGWAPWQRVDDWPAGAGAAAPVRLVLRLGQPARGGERFDLMLAGRLRALEGAALTGDQALCQGGPAAMPARCAR